MQRTALLPFGASGGPWPIKDIDLAEIAQVGFNFKKRPLRDIDLADTQPSRIQIQISRQI